METAIEETAIQATISAKVATGAMIRVRNACGSKMVVSLLDRPICEARDAIGEQAWDGEVKGEIQANKNTCLLTGCDVLKTIT